MYIKLIPGLYHLKVSYCIELFHFYDIDTGYHTFSVGKVLKHRILLGLQIATLDIFDQKRINIGIVKIMVLF